jgi:hypothetical protein
MVAGERTMISGRSAREQGAGPPADDSGTPGGAYLACHGCPGVLVQHDRTRGARGPLGDSGHHHSDDPGLGGGGNPTGIVAGPHGRIGEPSFRDLSASGAVGGGGGPGDLTGAGQTLDRPLSVAPSTTWRSIVHPTFSHRSLRERDRIPLVILRRPVRMPSVVCHDATL